MRHRTEDKLEPRVGYMQVVDPSALAAVPETPHFPEFARSLTLQPGDILYITIIGPTPPRIPIP